MDEWNKPLGVGSTFNNKTIRDGEINKYKLNIFCNYKVIRCHKNTLAWGAIKVQWISVNPYSKKYLILCIYVVTDVFSPDVLVYIIITA